MADLPSSWTEWITERLGLDLQPSHWTSFSSTTIDRPTGRYMVINGEKQPVLSLRMKT